MRTKSSILALAVITLMLGSLAPAPASAAETVLGDQILTSDLILTPSGSPYKLRGYVQIPKEFRLVIQPGTTVLNEGGGIYSEREVLIGSNSGPRTIIEWNCNTGKLGLAFLSPQSQPFIQNTEFRATSNCPAGIVYFHFHKEISIENSLFDGWGIHTYDDQKMTLTNNIFVNKYKMGYGDKEPVFFEVRQSNSTSLKVIQDNLFFNFSGVEFRNSYGQTDLTRFNRNYFLNEDIKLTISIRLLEKVPSFEIKNNVFASKETLREFRLDAAPEPAGKPLSGFDLSSNFWPGYNSEQEIRASIKLPDRVSIVSSQVKVTLDPLLNSEPKILTSASQSFLTALKAAADKAAADKAAADKAAADKAAADKAAADKAAADKAAADKAAADKAAADKAAADKAAADKAAALKKKTILCVKGKLIKKVTSVMPKCPTGYKLKK